MSVQEAGGPIWLPPIEPELILAIALILAGANIEQVPTEYHATLSNPLVFFLGMLVSAGLASMKNVPMALAVAFFLVNLIRLLPKKSIVVPGKKEGFMVPSGTLDWVTTQKKWFVEKVLLERPVAIQEKEVVTYPIHS
jgi:hypothetical protein